MSTTQRLLAITTLTAALAAPVAAQPAGSSDIDQLRREVEGLKKGQEAIQKDLDEIKQLLKTQPRQPAARNPNQVPPNTVLDLTGHAVKGAASAQLAVIEFLDYQ